jgi:hypothetical protein
MWVHSSADGDDAAYKPCRDVREATVKDLVGTAPPVGGALAWLRSSRDCPLRGIRATESDTLIRLSGAETARVHVVAAGGRSAPHVVLLDSNVETTARRTEGSVTSRGGRGI